MHSTPFVNYFRYSRLVAAAVVARTQLYKHSSSAAVEIDVLCYAAGDRRLCVRRMNDSGFVCRVRAAVVATHSHGQCTSMLCAYLHGRTQTHRKGHQINGPKLVNS